VLETNRGLRLAPFKDDVHWIVVFVIIGPHAHAGDTVAPQECAGGSHVFSHIFWNMLLVVGLGNDCAEGVNRRPGYAIAQVSQ